MTCWSVCRSCSHRLFLASQHATKPDDGITVPVRVGVGELSLWSVDRGVVAEPVPGVNVHKLHLTCIVLRRRPAEVVVGDGRNHHFHLRPNGLVGREIIVFHQNLWCDQVGGHAGTHPGLVLILPGTRLDVAAGHVDAQFVPLHLLRPHAGDVLVNTGGGSQVAGATASVGILCVLVDLWPERVLQAKANSPVSFCSVTVVIN